MALQRTDQEKLCCSICLDLLKEPVTIPCGHSYCMSCIRSYWDEEGQKEVHSCPQCRQTFTPSPVLVRNTTLADLVEELKKTGLHAARADHCYAGPGDVACDFCTGRKLKALKSCLQCLVSYCEQHLQPHYESPAFEKHKLVDPSRKLQENVCSRHNEVMKIFCRTDQKCICYLCSMDDHKSHDTVSAAAEMTEKQRELGASQKKTLQKIQDREKVVKTLQREVESINHSADRAVRDSEKICTDAKQRIRARQRTEVTHIKKLQDKLQQELDELRKKDKELTLLSHTEDHTQFLHNYALLARLGESADTADVTVSPPTYTEDMAGAVSEVRDKLEDIVSERWTEISLTDNGVDVLLPQAGPNTRAEFLKYLCQITLDPITANARLHFVDIRHIMLWNVTARYPHPDRFADWPQVLCREILTGRCYWEVEWSGEVFLAVAYKDISRKGDESVFGNNDKSWAFECFVDGYEFRHNKIRTSISGPHSSRLGVYVDHRAGVLSFYSVSETMTLLHRVQTTFTQPLCPGFSMYAPNASAKICIA